MPQFPRTFTDTYTPDRLIAGLTQIITENMTLLAGAALLRGSVVGRITASGKVTLSASAASDGSQVPYGILADDYDATAGDVPNAAVMVKGEFDIGSLTFGTGQTATTVHDALRDAGIYLKTAWPA
jgi:hypothetical protein